MKKLTRNVFQRIDCLFNRMKKAKDYLWYSKMRIKSKVLPAKLNTFSDSQQAKGLLFF
jgi:hypothetical protein